MKIAMVITSLEVGGAEKMVLDLISYLIRNYKENIKINLYIIKKNYHTIYDEYAKTLPIKITYFNNQLKLTNPVILMRLSKCLSIFSPDIIHTHLKSSSYVKYHYKFHKDFIWIHTVHTIAHVDTKIIRRLQFRKLYKDKKIFLVSVSKKVELSLVRLFHNLSVRTIPNGIDLTKFNPTKNEQNKNNHNEFSICHVGRFVPIKNHKYLINEFSKVLKVIPNVKLILIGDGKLKTKMMEYSKKLHILANIDFIGHTNEVEKYLQKSKVFVLPSLYEGMPISLLEAMASGLIVVGSRATNEIVMNQKNGFLIDLKENELSNLLLKIIESIDSLDHIKEQALITSQNYSIENMGNKYYELYEELIND